MKMTLGSLFDGIGGWLLAAKHAGVKPLWASEIASFPTMVTAKHFPDVVQLGDITKIKDLPPVDIVTCGSPCQDLSVVGKRKGLNGERSGLFVRAVELVRRLRMSTGGRYPRYFVWENVPGAFSSNKGADFRAVLEEITESAIPMPPNNKWAEAGVVEWDGGSLAWRVLDAQYWGVPQRRKRIFLITDFRSGRAGEVLFERKSMHGDFEAGGETREGIAGSAESGIDGAIGVALKSGALTGNTACALTTEGRTAGATGPTVYIPDKTRTITARNDGSPCVDRGPEIIAAGSLTPWDKEGMRIHSEGGVSTTLRAHASGGNAPEPIFIAAGFKAGGGSKAGGIGYEVEKAATLSADHSGTEPTVAVYGVGLEGRVAGTLDASYYKGPGNRSGKERGAICVFDMTHADEVLREVGGDKSNTLNARMGTGGNQVPVIANNKSVRRLTPTECERLQGLPDGYTLIDDKTCSDTARYKALGNGMAQPCADYVIRRIVEVMA